MLHFSGFPIPPHLSKELSDQKCGEEMLSISLYISPVSLSVSCEAEVLKCHLSSNC